MFPFHNRDFSLFLCAQATSNLGDSTRAVLVPLLVLQLTHSPLLVAGTAGLFLLPNLILQLPFGALLDRWDRRRTMLFADVGRGAITLLVPLAAVTHGPVLATAVPLGVLAALFGAGFGAFSPSLVEERELGRAFALTEGVESAAWIVGPGLAGLLAATIGAAQGLAVDGLSFFVSGLGMYLIRARGAASSRPEPVWASLVTGLRFFVRQAMLLRVQAVWTLYLMIGSAVVTGIVYVGSNGGHGSALLVSIAVATYAAGSLVGTLGAGWVRPLGRWATIGASTAVLTAGAAMMAYGPFQAPIAGAVLIVGAALFGLGEGTLLVVHLEERARSTPDRLMGRVSSVSGLLAIVATALAQGWLGLALQWLGGSGAFLLMTGALVALTAGVFFGGRTWEATTR